MHVWVCMPSMAGETKYGNINNSTYRIPCHHGNRHTHHTEEPSQEDEQNTQEELNMDIITDMQQITDIENEIQTSMIWDRILSTIEHKKTQPGLNLRLL